MKLKNLVESKYGSNIDLSNRGLLKLPDDLPHIISGDFDCYGNALTTLEHCPSQVGGDFYCHNNKLTTLEHCPFIVGSGFICNSNELTSLKYCPSKVGGDFYCGGNELVSLEYSPSKVAGGFVCNVNKLTSLERCPSIVEGVFDCKDNALTSLRDIHKHIKKIGGSFRCNNNPIKSHVLGLMLIQIGGNITTCLDNGLDVDEILNRWKNQGRKGVLGAQRELLDLGYEELAQL